MMNSTFRMVLALGLLVPITGLAQEEHRMRIERERTVNGNTEHEVWEFTAPDEDALADSLMSVGDDLRYGRRPMLGVGLQGLSEEVDGIGGVLVVHVAPGSPAALSGLRPGDRIMAVDGQVVEGPEDVIGIVQDHRPGDQLEVSYMRGDDPRSCEVTLAKQPAPTSKPRRKWPYRGWSFDEGWWPEADPADSTRTDRLDLRLFEQLEELGREMDGLWERLEREHRSADKDPGQVW